MNPPYLIIDVPYRVELSDLRSELPALKKALTFENKANRFEYNRFRKSPYWAEKLGEERFKEECDKRKEAINVCLLKEESDGSLWTYSGLAAFVQNQFGGIIQHLVEYPEYGTLPWYKVPAGEDRYYQKHMHDNLLLVKHGAVEVGTGLGKSRVIRNLTHTIGLKTIVLAPTLSIAGALYRDFLQHFGKAKVGFFGDGKKECGKQITVGTYQSFARVEEGSKEWKELSKVEVFIVDESHLTPAATLKQVCEGLAGNAPYRFFFSGTQMRNDGADLLLEGIIGPVVYEMTVEQGVKEGYLSKPNFYMVEMWSDSSYISGDLDYMQERHFFANPQVYKRAAEIANKSVELLGHQVLILVEEVTQFQHLWPLLRHQFGFAHGGVTKKNSKFVPEAYHKSDPDALVDQLNAGELPILIGTSCISIGTDIRTPKTIINLQGGTSEPKIRQAVGRGTRRENGVKEEFNYWDFCVKVRHPEDDEYEAPSHRQAITRLGIYRSIYPSVKVVK